MARSIAIRWADVDQPAVVGLALSTGLSSYDATYLHVAQTLRLPLVTFDHRMQVAAEELGIASIEASATRHDS
jgi:predicted nucleic acid-binding protein